MLEAETIAAWVMENKEKIENDYHKSIYEVIGVVTPFSAQVASIRQAFEKLGLWNASDENGITIGTVHSLQGAERAIVIFSPVYSKHEDGGFIDSDNSMLNVAISRAKDSFLVFGDMDLFEVQPPSSPRGLLAKYLFSSENNALYFASKERNDLKVPRRKFIRFMAPHSTTTFCIRRSNRQEQALPSFPLVKLAKTGADRISGCYVAGMSARY